MVNIYIITVTIMTIIVIMIGHAYRYFQLSHYYCLIFEDNMDNYYLCIIIVVILIYIHSVVLKEALLAIVMSMQQVVEIFAFLMDRHKVQPTYYKVEMVIRCSCSFNSFQSMEGNLSLLPIMDTSLDMEYTFKEY